MQVIVELVAVLLVLGVAYAYFAPALARRRASTESITGPTTGRMAEIESADAYRNHLGMARWIELQLKDDLVRSSVPNEEQVRAKRLLDEFYGEDR